MTDSEAEKLLAENRAQRSGLEEANAEIARLTRAAEHSKNEAKRAHGFLLEAETELVFVKEELRTKVSQDLDAHVRADRIVWQLVELGDEWAKDPSAWDVGDTENRLFRRLRRVFEKAHAELLKELAEAKIAVDEAQARAALKSLLSDHSGFVSAVLRECDPSNWDADGHEGDYYRGLKDAFETVQDLANEYIDGPSRRRAKSVLAGEKVEPDVSMDQEDLLRIRAAVFYTVANGSPWPFETFTSADLRATVGKLPVVLPEDGLWVQWRDW